MWRAALLRDDDGVVAVETALVSSLILIPLLLGLSDVAQLAIAKARVQEALQDALTYVAATNSTSSAQITSAAQAAYGSSISVSSSQACYCVATGTTTPTMPTSVSCTASCLPGTTLAQFERITVSQTVQILFSVQYLASSVTIASTGLVQTGP